MEFQRRERVQRRQQTKSALTKRSGPASASAAGVMTLRNRPAVRVRLFVLGLDGRRVKSTRRLQVPKTASPAVDASPKWR